MLDPAGGGCTRPALPHDLPPWGAVGYSSGTWRDAGVRQRAHHALRAEIRGADGREPTPTAGTIDSPSVTTTGAGTTGGRTAAGREPHLVVGTLRLIRGPAARPASPAGWGGGVEVFRRVGENRPRLAKVWPRRTTGRVP